MGKLKRIAKGLDVFLKLIFWLIAVMCAVAAVVAVLTLIFGEQLWEQSSLGEMVISFNGIDCDVNDIASADFARIFAVMTAFFVAAGAIVLYGIRVVRKMLQPMKEGRPFDTAVSQSFKRLGWLSLIYGVAGIIIRAVSQQLMSSVFSKTALQAGASTGTMHVFDGSFVLVAVLLFLFSYIFRYGEELQAQSDETL